MGHVRREFWNTRWASRRQADQTGTGPGWGRTFNA